MKDGPTNRETGQDLAVGRDHVGDVADGEGLAGLQAQGDRRAHTGVGAREHHVLHSQSTFWVNQGTKKRCSTTKHSIHFLGFILVSISQWLVISRCVVQRINKYKQMC